MKLLTLQKQLLNPITLPGMGRSIEITNIPQVESGVIRVAFMKKELFVQFETEENVTYPVINIWPDPHDPSRITLFIK